jgi:hypothetical protein
VSMPSGCWRGVTATLLAAACCREVAPSTQTATRQVAARAPAAAPAAAHKPRPRLSINFEWVVCRPCLQVLRVRLWPPALAWTPLLTGH